MKKILSALSLALVVAACGGGASTSASTAPPVHTDFATNSAESTRDDSGLKSVLVDKATGRQLAVFEWKPGAQETSTWIQTDAGGSISGTLPMASFDAKNVPLARVNAILEAAWTTGRTAPRPQGSTGGLKIADEYGSTGPTCTPFGPLCGSYPAGPLTVEYQQGCTKSDGTQGTQTVSTVEYEIINYCVWGFADCSTTAWEEDQYQTEGQNVYPCN